VFGKVKWILIFSMGLTVSSCGGGISSSASTTDTHVLSRVINPSVQNNLVQNLAVGDLNGDGLDDVVIGGWNSDAPTANMAILIQNPNGTLTDQTSTLLQGSSTYGGSQHTFIADFNNDGRPDVFFPGFGDGSVETPQHSVVLWNTPHGFTRTDLPELTMSHGACIDDINGDGYMDVLVAGGYSGSVGGIYINQQGQGFVLDQTHLAPVTANNFFSACAVTHEANGNINILFGNTNSVTGYRNNIAVLDSQLQVISNTGLNDVDANGHSTTGSDLINALAIDINGDGHQDFVAIYNMLGPNGSPAFIGDSASKQIFLWSANSVFTESSTIDTEFENLYFTETLIHGGVPFVLFGGSNNQARFYQLVNGAFAPYQQQRFTDMGVQAGVPNPSQIDFSIGNAGVYQGSGNFYMIQLIRGVWYTELM